MVKFNLINNKGFIAVAIIALAIVTAVFGFYFFKFSDSLNINNKAEWGVFGDFVGGTLNPLLSFFGFMALLYTVLIQREQLEHDKNVQKQQQFASTFFALLDLHNQSLERLCESNLKNFIADDLNIAWYNHLSSAKKILDANKNLYGHYFSILYQLLEFIATNSPNSKIGLNFEIEEINNCEVSSNEKKYSNIVKALLPDDVMKLLAVHCYCTNQDDIHLKYKLLVERYALFQHASFNMEIENSLDDALVEAQEFYDKKAFGL